MNQRFYRAISKKEQRYQTINFVIKTVNISANVVYNIYSKKEASAMTLTIDEFNAISHYTARTKLNQSYDIKHDDKNDEDYFIDYDDNNKIHSIKWGLKEINGAMAVYPFEHYISDKETNILYSLLESFEIR